MAKHKQETEPPVDSGFISRSELARRLGISIGTVHNHTKKGLLPAIKLGHLTKFHWPTVEQALLRRQREVAA